MFTNWLTGTSGTNNNHNNQQQNNNNQNLNNNFLTHNSHENRATTNLLTHPAGHILMSTPPDVVLEVGPAPSTVRFVAHSIVLGMHSGYLRSAIRLDEHVLAERSTTSSASSAGAPDFVLFLSNVTAEQFAPLLTYMYTGYLDLNIENIFGVLLATHVLHMPRALEICRAFLARAQTEGYLGARLTANTNQQTTATNLSNTNSSHTNNNKIIRPIPSKPAAMPHFGYLPTVGASTTAATQHQQMLANFKQLQRHQENLYQQQTQQQTTLIENEPTNNEIKHGERAKSEEIDVDQESLKATSEIDYKSSDKETIQVHNDENDDEDEEVFIDSDSDLDNMDNVSVNDDEMEVIIEVKQNNKTHNKNKEKQQKSTKATTAPTAIKSKDEKRKGASNSKTAKKDTTNNSNRSQHHQPQSQQTKRRNTTHKSRSGLQIAKAPIPASQLELNEGAKVIIDVASCDGPVRFRRILNTAYGHKPEDLTQQQITERSQQSVSYSFHQQMARTIHHQQQQQQHRKQLQHALGGEESENSESSGGGGGTGSKHHKNAAQHSNSNEIYVCVYCKHTFKSQYCYQKHAKRHLNPLSLNPTERCDSNKSAAAVAAANVNLNFNGAQFSSTTATSAGVGGNIVPAGCLPMPPLLATKQTANDLLRREVRPLDMNVQYYPCKTCGSKFPSYYFVHKHRKLCHADEELNQVESAVKPKQTNGSTDTSHGSSSTNNEEIINKDQQSNQNDLLDLKTGNVSHSVSNSSNASDNAEEHQIKHEH